MININDLFIQNTMQQIKEIISSIILTSLLKNLRLRHYNIPGLLNGINTLYCLSGILFMRLYIPYNLHVKATNYVIVKSQRPQS